MLFSLKLGFFTKTLKVTITVRYGKGMVTVRSDTVRRQERNYVYYKDKMKLIN
jgi:hypothetical protein